MGRIFAIKVISENLGHGVSIALVFQVYYLGRLILEVGSRRGNEMATGEVVVFYFNFLNSFILFNSSLSVYLLSNHEVM